MIYKGSRYTHTPVVEDNGVNVFSTRMMSEFSYRGCKSHTVIEGDTLDYLAYRYYGSSAYWWVFLDANPQYVFPTDIKPGDILIVPHISEVV